MSGFHSKTQAHFFSFFLMGDTSPIIETDLSPIVIFSGYLQWLKNQDLSFLNPKINFSSCFYLKTPKKTIKTSINHLPTLKHPKITKKIEINQIKNKQTHVHREIKSSPSNSFYQMKLKNIKINYFGCHNMANKRFFSLLSLSIDFLSLFSNLKTKK